MTDNFKTLHNIRMEISQEIWEAKILFQKIYECETICETMTLAGIGEKICQNTGQNCEKLELAIEKARKSL